MTAQEDGRRGDADAVVGHTNEAASGRRDAAAWEVSTVGMAFGIISTAPLVVGSESLWWMSRGV